MSKNKIIVKYYKKLTFLVLKDLMIEYTHTIGFSIANALVKRYQRNVLIDVLRENFGEIFSRENNSKKFDFQSFTTII